MKLYFLIALCAVAGVTASQVKVVDVVAPELSEAELQNRVQSRNFLVNILVTQMFNYIRRIINNGSQILNIPVLDPLVIEDNRFNIPAGLLNLDIAIKNGLMTGVGGFVVNRSVLNLSDLTFDLDVTFPHLVISAEQYDLLGDIFTAIPLYGAGLAFFELENFKLYGKFNLKQSDNGRSVLIDSVENPGFELPVIRTKLTGVIGGGDIDNVVNAIIEEVIVDYIDRFSGAIARLSAHVIPIAANPILAQLPTWQFISPFV